jgi:ABC-type nitrate/sulfonate/bicarbonate transport system permease component
MKDGSITRAPRMIILRPLARLVSSNVARKLLVPLLVILVWAVASTDRLVQPIFLPSPGDLWDSLIVLGPFLPNAIVSSVTMVLMGFALGTTLGIGMGLAMAYSRTVRDLLGGTLDFFRPVPIFALIPLFVLWFGIGRAPQVALVALGTSVLLGVTTVEAIRNVPPVYLHAALTLGSGRSRIYRSVIIPWLLPNLLGAIRVAAAASWGLGVAGEFLGAQTGLGFLMIVRSEYLDTAGIVVIVLIYSLLSLALDQLILFAEAPLTRWTERGRRTGVAAALLGRA